MASVAVIPRGSRRCLRAREELGEHKRENAVDRGDQDQAATAKPFPPKGHEQGHCADGGQPTQVVENVGRLERGGFLLPLG
ncbi:MAG: hypothetical protein MZV70_03045 [Desulfobacterales bacterium]|nr:hypothetical protein [Desulfobacterales bacterium]